MYGSTLSLNSVLDGGGWSTPRPRPLYRRERRGTHCIGGWVGPQGRSGRVWKISPPPRFDPRTVQSVTSHIPSTLTRPTLQMSGESIFSQNFCLYSSLEVNFMDGSHGKFSCVFTCSKLIHSIFLHPICCVHHVPSLS